MFPPVMARRGFRDSYICLSSAKRFRHCQSGYLPSGRQSTESRDPCLGLDAIGGLYVRGSTHALCNPHPVQDELVIMFCLLVVNPSFASVLDRLLDEEQCRLEFAFE